MKRQDKVDLTVKNMLKMRPETHQETADKAAKERKWRRKEIKKKG